jgi:hypothetical protein
MPPQAAAKSPASSFFSAGVQGEWSETISSISPSFRPPQSFSRLSRSRIGGAHLNGRGAVGHVLRGEVQVVRRGLGGEGQALAAGLA